MNDPENKYRAARALVWDGISDFWHPRYKAELG